MVSSQTLKLNEQINSKKLSILIKDKEEESHNNKSNQFIIKDFKSDDAPYIASTKKSRIRCNQNTVNIGLLSH